MALAQGCIGLDGFGLAFRFGGSVVALELSAACWNETGASTQNRQMTITPLNNPCASLLVSRRGLRTETVGYPSPTSKTSCFWAKSL